MLRADGCVVTPGLVNTHHHIYQNLTRSFEPVARSGLFEWLRTLFPQWALLDEEAIYLSVFVGLAELALGGCTTTTDHLYVHPKGGGDLLAASVVAAREVGLRFHPTRGPMCVSEKDGGLAPDQICEDEDTILAASEAAVQAYHDRAPGAMLRIALAPCCLRSPGGSCPRPPSWPVASMCASTPTSPSTLKKTPVSWNYSAAGLSSCLRSWLVERPVLGRPLCPCQPVGGGPVGWRRRRGCPLPELQPGARRRLGAGYRTGCRGLTRRPGL